MAYIRRRKFRFKASYIAQVKRKGFKTIVKSFDTKTQAQKWARGIERKLDMGDFSDYSEASKLTLGDLLKRYRAENKHRLKKDWKNEEYKIGYILKDTIAWFKIQIEPHDCGWMYTTIEGLKHRIKHLRSIKR